MKNHNFKGANKTKNANNEILTPKPTMEKRFEGLVQEGQNVSGVNLRTIIIGLASKLKVQDLGDS